MAVTSDKITSQDEHPRWVCEGPVSPFVEFRLALGLYALWATLAWVSVQTGQTSLARHGAFVLLMGIGATNALFLLISASSPLYRPPAATITLAQSVMGITWATLFLFMSSGIAELVVGMYVTAILIALPRVPLNALAQLGAFAMTSYALVQVIKATLTAPQRPLWPELIGTAVFAAVVGLMLAIRYQRYDLARFPASVPEAALAESADEPEPAHEVERRHTHETLRREKGRADRTNHPFSICILAVDDMDRFATLHGTEKAERLLRAVAAHARGELRAMDGLGSIGDGHSLGRLGHEQYAVILPQTTLDRAGRCAERIRCAVRKDPIDDRFGITVSGGIAEYRRGESVGGLLRRAEAALALAQAAGGNRIAGGRETRRHQAEVFTLPQVRR